MQMLVMLRSAIYVKTNGCVGLATMLQDYFGLFFSSRLAAQVKAVCDCRPPL